MSAALTDLVRGAGWLTGWWEQADGDDGRVSSNDVFPGPFAEDLTRAAEASFQLRLEDALRQSDDPAVVAGAGCAAVAAQFGALHVLLFSFASETSGAVPEGAWPADAGAAIAQSSDTARYASSADGEGQDAAIIRLPILRDGDRVALIMVIHGQPGKMRDSDITLLRQASERIWRACERAREIADLRRSEHEHRMAMALCRQTFWTATPDGRLDNQGLIFGQLATRHSDQLDQGWRQTTHPDDLPNMERVISRCLRTGDTYDLEHRTLDENGRARWVHTYAKPVRGPDGAIERWFGTVTDIHRRKQAEAALKASEDRFQRAIAGARVGTWDWDMGTDEVVTSPGFAPLFHDLPEGSIRNSQDFVGAIHPDDRARLSTVLAAVIDLARRHGTAEYEAEYRVIRSDGEVRWLGAQGNVTISPGPTHGGRLSGVTVDMTERRRAEMELNAAQDRLQELNAGLAAQVRREVEMREQAQSLLAQSQRMEALGQLAGGIAHDFNNVLQAVIAGLDLLQRRAERPDAVRKLAARTSEAAARGIAITGRLLSFARRSDLKAQEVEPLPLMEGLRDLLAPTLGVNITMKIAGALDLPAAIVDRAQLETVLVNLALNARDAMPDGGTLTITAEAAMIVDQGTGSPGGHAPTPDLPVGQYMCFAIEDTGIGMTPDVLERASEPFFTTKPVGQGTGLGLAMARGFAEQSGGALTLTSVAGRGTTVWLWFPAGQRAATEIADDVPDLPPTPPHPPCVLVVDDDTLVRAMLVNQIEDMGYHVIEADGAAAALGHLNGGACVDLVVTDYAMPGMNGAALAAVLRQTHPNLPVLLITGYVDDSLRIDTASWDAATIMLLRKPLSATALSHAMSALMASCKDRQVAVPA